MSLRFLNVREEHCGQGPSTPGWSSKDFEERGGRLVVVIDLSYNLSELGKRSLIVRVQRVAVQSLEDLQGFLSLGLPDEKARGFC